MTERRGNERRDSIDHWETVEVLHSDTTTVGRDSIGLVVEVQRPVFEGGREGRLSMGAVLTRGGRMLRFRCQQGDTAEISALRRLFSAFDEEKLGALTAKFDELRAEHDPKPRERGSRSGGGEAKPGSVGGGLSRFSKTSKRERRRQKRQGDRPEH